MTDEEYIKRERQVAEDVKTILREFARETAEEDEEVGEVTDASEDNHSNRI